MLQNRDRRALEFPDQVGGRGDVQDIVVAELLALQLLIVVVEGPVERRLLVRVLPVAQGLRLAPGQSETVRKAAQRGQVRLVRGRAAAKYSAIAASYAAVRWNTFRARRRRSAASASGAPESAASAAP